MLLPSTFFTVRNDESLLELVSPEGLVFVGFVHGPKRPNKISPGMKLRVFSVSCKSGEISDPLVCVIQINNGENTPASGWIEPDKLIKIKS
jgi:hypothetical protein